MQPELFVLCDAATDSQGKLNVLGVFDTIFAVSLPALHPQCAIAGRIRFEQPEGGEHSFKLTVFDGQGKPLLPPFEGKVQVKFEKPDQPARLNLIVSVGGLKFESYGPHSVELEIDGTRAANMPFYVSKPRTQPAAAEG